MWLGRYAVSWEAVVAIARITRDARRIRRHGIPTVPGETPAEIARAVLQGNAREVMRAGAGHFHPMWTADFGKAFTGALTCLPRSYLADLVSRIIRTSARVGHVPTCFTARRAFDIPWPRADNLPWLLHMVHRLDDPGFVDAHYDDLEKAYADWVEAHVDYDTGLVHPRVTGDWMDTVPRPSSTYNNLCAIHAYRIADALDIRSAPTFQREAERALLERRWTGTHLRDHVDADDTLSADANVPALYLELLPERIRHRIADTLEASTLHYPFPMKTREDPHPPDRLPPITRLVANYHATVWLHLGAMYAVGLRHLGRHYEHHQAQIEEAALTYRNFLETLEEDGDPHHTPFMATEHGFTMSAGLYLELISMPPAVQPLAESVVSAIDLEGEEALQAHE